MPLAALLLASAATRFFRIDVVDAASGRGVPLVELRTVNGIRHVTDGRGLVAFDEPGLMEGEVYFHVQSHGYELPADGFGYRGVALKPRAGGRATIRLPRRNVAERLPRLTGAGIYRDSILLGEPTPLRAPVRNGGVLGQDTAQAVVYRGRMLWFWGDTDRAGYPLGNFRTSGAVASLPRGGAENGIEFAYFTGKEGFVRPMVPSTAEGPIWVGGVVVLKEGGEERLYAHYTRMKSLGVVLESGLLRWDDRAERFAIVQTFGPEREWRYLDSHPFLHEGYAYGNAFANVRVRADAASLLNPRAYEAFTPLGPDGHVLRVGNLPDYRWQRELPPIDSAAERRLVEAGELKREETRFLPRDPEGKPVEIANGSIRWNAHRGRWIGIFGRKGGARSLLGEIVYAEAESPAGPFRRAIPIVEHDRYTFYNPVHHAFLDRGSAIYFEGTYTHQFSGNDDRTPRYDYNQILYRLDLDDPRLVPARG